MRSLAYNACESPAGIRTLISANICDSHETSIHIKFGRRAFFLSNLLKPFAKSKSAYGSMATAAWGRISAGFLGRRPPVRCPSPMPHLLRLLRTSSTPTITSDRPLIARHLPARRRSAISLR